MTAKTATSASPEATSPEHPPMDTAQLRKMHALLRDNGITTDAAVYAYLSRALGREVASRKEVTKVEGARINAELEAAPVAHAPGGLARALLAFQAEMPSVRKGNTADTGSYRYCLTPETMVLTADLHYMPIGKVAAGDVLAGFDEDGPRRRWRPATVLAAHETVLPCYRVTLSDGTVVTASEGHLWLAQRQNRFKWMRTDQLRSATARTIRCPDGHRHPTRLTRVTDVWQQDTSWASGYVAGALDGEGSLVQQQRVMHLSLSQRNNYLLRTVEAALAGHRFDFSRREGGGTNSDVCTLRLNGGVPEVMRALGIFQPGRLRFDLARAGQMRATSYPHVQSVEPVGEQTVVALQTSTGTLVAEGLATHNSYADLTDVSAAAIPLLNRFGVTFTASPRLTTGGGYELVGILRHVSGETDEGSLPLYGKDLQQIGGSITYARRYLLGCMTGIVTDDDDDNAWTRSERRHTTEPQDPDRNTPAEPVTPLPPKAVTDDEKQAALSLVVDLAGAAAAAGLTIDEATADWRAANGGLMVEHLTMVHPDVLDTLYRDVAARGPVGA